MKLLEKLCGIHAPSSDEFLLKEFLLDWIYKNLCTKDGGPKVIDDYFGSVILIFGKPRTAAFAHIDSTGFTVRYFNEIIEIGSPGFKDGDCITGFNGKERIEASIKIDKENNNVYINYPQILPPGTTLTFRPDFRIDGNEIHSPYLDNRLGVWVMLEIARDMQDGIIVFTCNEEHGGGCVEKATRMIYENYNVTQALIADVTWVTGGVFCGKGPVVSLRDKFIPPRRFVEKICRIIDNAGIKFQKEVEESGSSDGGYIHRTPYPVEWCFLGIAEENNHTNHEKIAKNDIYEMVKVYKVLMKEL